MPRALILVPPGRVAGAVPIGPGYPRTTTSAEMRGWADDLSGLYRLAEDESGLPVGQRLQQASTTGRETLDPATARLVDAHRHFMTDPSEGIAGSLRPDGTVELDKGRHRAHYVIERGIEPVPVWVSDPDAGELQAFRAQCNHEVSAARPRLLAQNRELGRVAVRGAAEEEPPPPVKHLVGEKLERSRDRDVFRGERL